MAARTAHCAARLFRRKNHMNFASWGGMTPLLSRNYAADAFIGKDEVSERVLTVIKNFEKVDVSAVNASSKFIEDLGLDSLDTVRITLP